MQVCRRGYEKLSGVQRYFVDSVRDDYAAGQLDAQVEGVLLPGRSFQECVVPEWHYSVASHASKYHNACLARPLRQFTGGFYAQHRPVHLDEHHVPWYITRPQLSSSQLCVPCTCEVRAMKCEREERLVDRGTLRLQELAISLRCGGSASMRTRWLGLPRSDGQVPCTGCGCNMRGGRLGWCLRSRAARRQTPEVSLSYVCRGTGKERNGPAFLFTYGTDGALQENRFKQQ